MAFVKEYWWSACAMKPPQRRSASQKVNNADMLPWKSIIMFIWRSQSCEEAGNTTSNSDIATQRPLQNTSVKTLTLNYNNGLYTILGSLNLNYRQFSNIRRTQSQNINVFSSCLAVVFHWNHVLSWEWRCSWSSADKRCSNYIWVVNNFIAY